MESRTKLYSVKQKAVSLVVDDMVNLLLQPAPSGSQERIQRHEAKIDLRNRLAQLVPKYKKAHYMGIAMQKANEIRRERAGNSSN